MKEKSLLEKIGFNPKEGENKVFSKSYNKNYTLDVDLEKNTIHFGGKIKIGEKLSQNITKPEDWVVLECVNRLLEKGYKPEDIILEKPFKVGHGNSGGRLDIFVKKKGRAFLMIECKTYGKQYNKELANIHKNGGQLLSYFQNDTKADYLMLYSSELIDGDIKNQQAILKIEDHYRDAGNVVDVFERWNKITFENGIFETWVDAYCFENKRIIKKELIPLDEKASIGLFHNFLSILRKHSVSDKPNAFNVIFDLFLSKLWDEKKEPNEEMEFQWKENEDDSVSFQYRLLDLYRAGMDDFLKKEVFGLSDDEFNAKNDEELKRIKKKVLMLEKVFNIKSVIDEDSFEENHRVLKEVVELLQGYQIRYPRKQQHLSDFFERLLTTGLKQEAGQFFTPPPITRFIVKSLPVKQVINESINQTSPELPAVVDYAAGSGHFLTEIMEEYQTIINRLDVDRFKTDAKKFVEKWRVAPYDWAIDYVYGIDKDYRLVKTAKVGCYFYGDGLAQVIHGDGLDNFKHSKSYRRLLKKNAEKPQFQFVLSNPPYSVSAFKTTLRAKDAEKDFTLFNQLTDRSSEIECLFVERTKQLLKEGGIAAIILPSSILSNSGIYTKTREILLKYFEFVAITELGSNTFMATGTNTVVLFLRRRKDRDWQRIQEHVDKFMEQAKDVTVNGVGRVFSKYVEHVWEGVSFKDYITLIQGNPNTAIQNHEIYKDYVKKIKVKKGENQLTKIPEIEAEKLLYFILAYPQKLVLVKTGEKSTEKAFLGYEFSNRRGHEGMHPIQRGKTVDECTQLYDLNVSDNPTKASTYILDVLEGNEEREIDESLKNHVNRMDLVDMMTWDRVDFEKNINLRVKKKIKIESRWDVVKLGELKSIVEFTNGYAFKSANLKSKKTHEGEMAVLKIGNIKANEYITNFDGCEFHSLANFESKIVGKGDLVIALTGATVGKAGWVTQKSLLNQRVLALSGDELFLKYISNFIFGNFFYEYSQIIAHGNAQGNLSPDQVKDFKIPLPPLNVQEKIVKEIEVLEQEEAEIRKEVEGFKKSIELTVKKSEISSKKNLGTILSLEYGSSLPERDRIKGNFPVMGSNGIVGWHNKFIVEAPSIIIGRKGSAGKANWIEKNNFPIDTTFYVNLIDESVLLKFLYFVLKELSLEKLALGTGVPGLNRNDVYNLKFGFPPLPEQQKIVTKIEKIEAQIEILETQLAEIPAKKEAILKKYL